ncbi:hypothetical protein Tco_0425726 [Tanacetum coccineum]
MNSQLWHACAGPMVSLPPVGSLVVYFPQGHNEQVAASMQKDTHNIHPNLPFKLICMLHNVTLHVYNQADAETNEVYAQMILQYVNKYDQTLVRKRYLYQTWVSSKTDNLLNSSAKLLPQVTPSPMVDSPFLFELPKRYSTPPQALVQLGDCNMTSLGLSDIFIEVTDISFPPVPSFITSSNTTLSAQKASTDDKINKDEDVDNFNTKDVINKDEDVDNFKTKDVVERI